MYFLSGIDVIPQYGTNPSLKRAMEEALGRSLDIQGYENGPRPRIIIFRPESRSGHTFDELVVPIIETSPKVYLVSACVGRPEDVSRLIPYSLEDRVVKTVAICMEESGALVSPNSPYYKYNQEQLKQLATKLSVDYSVQTVSKDASEDQKEWFQVATRFLNNVRARNWHWIPCNIFWNLVSCSWNLFWVLMRVKRDGWSPRQIIVFIVIPVTVLVILAIVLSTTL